VHNIEKQFQVLVVGTSYNGGMDSKGAEIQRDEYRSLLRIEKREREISDIWALTNLKRDFDGLRVSGVDVCLFQMQKE
jgi:hypothetical protein